MSKQTAVEWLIQRLHNRRNGIFDGHPVLNEQQLYEQALAMEREQIEEAFQTEWSAYNCSGNKYYERTYGKEGSHEA